MTAEGHILVETSPGHCHGEPLEKLAADCRKLLAEKGIQIGSAKSVDVWAVVAAHHEKYSLFPHNAKAMSRMELTEKVFYYLLANPS